MTFGVIATGILTVIIGLIWDYLYSHLHADFRITIILYCISTIVVIKYIFF